MTKTWRVALVVGAAVALFGVAPYVYFRSVYTHGKRLHEVVPGRVYRSGQLTVAGFTEVVQRYGIRTIVNVQDDNPDPDLFVSFWGSKTIRESELCARLGVRLVQIAPDLVSRRAAPGERPRAIDEFLAVLDREDTYPVLIHCKAGLHRTGILTAVYRMEYQGWSHSAAYHELKGLGFGSWACTSANDYVSQYVLSYRPGSRREIDKVTR
jgi:hypothetical protein